MLNIGIIAGSTRPGRKALAVAKWVHDVAQKRGGDRYELVDLLDYALPLLDEDVPAAAAEGKYAKAHTKAWSAKIETFDAFVFVTPEYNHGTPAALKNALDFLYAEWNDKAAGFVAYGGAGGVRAVEQLRLNLAELQMATVRNQVILSLRADFERFEVFTPGAHQEKAVNAMLDQLVAWGGALKTLRTVPREP
jgi:NAD(P)H-dependent FMN reductase